METSSHFCPGPCSHTQPQVRRNQLCICTSEIPSVMTIRLVKVCGQSNNRISFAQQQKLPANTLKQQKPCFHIHRISGGKKTTGGTLPTPVLFFISRKSSRDPVTVSSPLLEIPEIRTYITSRIVFPHLCRFALKENHGNRSRGSSNT